MTDQNKFCTFFLDGFFFGVEVARVQEVLRHQGMTKIPLAPTHIRGLINLRGQIVTAIDLREQLMLSEREDGVLPMNVVIRTERLLAAAFGSCTTTTGTGKSDGSLGRTRSSAAGPGFVTREGVAEATYPLDEIASELIRRTRDKVAMGEQ